MLKKLFTALCAAAVLAVAISVSAGPCTQQDKENMRQGGMSEARIQELCPDVTFPIWNREGNMLFNGSGEYVGREYSGSCHLVNYQDFQRCKNQADYEARYPYVDERTGARYGRDGFDNQNIYRARGECYGQRGSEATYCLRLAEQLAQEKRDREEANRKAQARIDCKTREKWSCGPLMAWDRNQCTCVCTEGVDSNGDCNKHCGACDK